MKTAKPGSWVSGRSLLAARWISDERVTRADGQHLFFGASAYRCGLVVYRAVDREEFWRLSAASRGARTPECDDDGLAPGEDPRRALTLVGEGPDDFAPCEGPMEISFSRRWLPRGGPTIYVVATARGADWPAAMAPGEWRPFSG